MFFGMSALSSIFWNQITQPIIRYAGVIPLVFCSDFFFRLGFRYGLSLFRPIVTIFIFILIGWWGTQYLDKHGFMVVESIVVAQHVGQISQELDSPYVINAPLAGAKQSSNVGCGTAIDYGVYALDIFVPLVELDQEERCMIRPFDSSHPRNDIPYSAIFDSSYGMSAGNIVLKNPTTWRVLQTLYILFGWIIVSASLLTFSGFLQRQSEGRESS